MTKKDYEKIAKALNAAYVATYEQNVFHGAEYMPALRIYADKVADALASTNPAFDRARFLKACGVE